MLHQTFIIPDFGYGLCIEKMCKEAADHVHPSGSPLPPSISPSQTNNQSWASKKLSTNQQ
jgi:hypothetical protein